MIADVVDFLLHLRLQHVYVLGLLIKLGRGALMVLLGARVTYSRDDDTKRDLSWPLTILMAIVWPLDIAFNASSLLFGPGRVMRAITRFYARRAPGMVWTVPVLSAELAACARIAGMRGHELTDDEIESIATALRTEDFVPDVMFEMRRPMTEFEATEVARHLEGHTDPTTIEATQMLLRGLAPAKGTPLVLRVRESEYHLLRPVTTEEFAKMYATSTSVDTDD